ncbi:MAG: hypothetical protein DRN04_05290, partial [Thermoprotei archaeon]
PTSLQVFYLDVNLSIYIHDLWALSSCLGSDEWLEYRLPKEFKVEGKVLGSWISKAGNTVIIVVEESLIGVPYRLLYWWNKKQ